ncbi:Rv3654c family TadE-like protein [Actinosynnema sp. NPDC020468]|uniref:Rv3654c family TadE-like protein n=1 Tax=Actinosynnema sp. NPDC020468 TaxID=3154488 RepID=UPI0033CA5CF4
MGSGLGRDERGSVSVVVVAVIGVVMAFVAFGVELGTAVVARHRVVAAADLGALAAASGLAWGVERACARAEWVVVRMGGRLDDCSVRGWEVVVEVSGAASVFGAPSARARAGPT